MNPLPHASARVAWSLAAWLLCSCGGNDEAVQVQAARPCTAGGVCVTTVAGSGDFGNVDGSVAMTRFSFPHAVAVDGEGRIHVADFGNDNLTRLIASGQVSTPAADVIEFPHPADVAIDAAGNRFLADAFGNRILKITPDGRTSVLAGTGRAGDGDGDAATATFSMPSGLAFDAAGVLYVADMGNRKIRSITFTAPQGAERSSTGTSPPDAASKRTT